MVIEIDLPALLLSTVCVAETEGSPMTASEIAFLLDLPRDDAMRGLRRLVADGKIKPDGDIFRLKRSLTASDVARINRLHEKLEQLRPIIEMLPLRLPS
jgi:DNA-binding IclR family transcriptional regulator